MRREIMSDAYLFSSCVKWVGFSDEVKNTRFGPGKRDITIIHYCTEGVGYFNGNRVEKGQGFVILPGDAEHYYPDEDEPWSFLWLCIDTNDPEGLLSYYRLDRRTNIFDYGFAAAVCELCGELEAAKNTQFGTLGVLLKLLEFHALESTSRVKKSAEEKYVQLGKRYIEMYYMNRITVADIARSVGVSTSYLYRCFMKELGVSPKRYLGSFRVGLAKRDLLSGERNVSEVGRSVGYDDVLEFSRFFKSVCGVSPSAYLKSQTGADREEL